MSAARIGISPEAFVSAFPFHVVFDRSFTILQVGPSLRRVCPSIEPGTRAEAVLRITGEALRNAVRHGRARCVTVTLAAEPLELTVEDDGRGFHPNEVVSRGFGLTSMRERAEGAGATYALTSADGQGTKVRGSWA